MTATRKSHSQDSQNAQPDAVDHVSNAAHDFADMASGVASDVKEEVTEARDAAASRLSDVTAKVGQTVTDARDAIVAGAGSAAAGLRDMAYDKAEGARETLSDVGARLAATLENSAAADHDGRNSLKSQVLSTVAEGLDRAATGLRQRSVAELADDVKELARRHPGAFMAAAAIAGFAAARFVRSSARRQMAMDVIDGLRGPRS